MKKILLLFAIVLGINLLLIAQQLPNPDFENWTGVNSPENWNIIEIDLGIAGTYYSAEKTTDAAFNSFAAKLETQSIFGNIMPGYVALGDVNINTMMPEGGIPFVGRPTGISFHYKYSPMTNDSMLMFTLLTKWNEAENKRDTISGTFFSQKELIGDYVKETVPIYYQSAEEPDTINVGFVASGNSPVVGSILYVDSVTMEYGLVNYPTVCVYASGVTPTEFTANWAPIFYSTGYYLDVATDADFTSYVSGYENKYFTSASLGYETHHTITGIPTGKYYYRVRVQYDLTETSENSNTIIVSMPTTSNSATDITHESFTANWDAVSSATEYLVDVATNENFTNFVTGYENAITSNNSMSVTGLLPSTDYFCRVRVVYDNDTSSYSNSVSVTTNVNTNIKKITTSRYNITTNNNSIIINSYNTLNSDIYIYNIQGKLILNKKISLGNNEFVINGKGIYIVKIREENNIFIKKIIIN